MKIHLMVGEKDNAGSLRLPIKCGIENDYKISKVHQRNEYLVTCEECLNDNFDDVN